MIDTIRRQETGAAQEAENGPEEQSKYRSRERGASKLTLIVFGSILIAAIYCAWRIAPFYYYFYEMQNQMQAAIRVASIESDQEIRKKLVRQMKTLDLPADPEKLMISRDAGVMTIDLKYKEVFDIEFNGKVYTIHVFPFHAHAKGVIK